MNRDEFVLVEQGKLLKEQELVEDDLEHLRELMLAEVDVEPDEGDAGVFERDKNAALIAVLERKLQDVNSALRSIDKGDYGTCARCGEPIEIERLEVKPDATLCVNCQREVERLAHRNRRSRQIDW